MQTNIKGLSVAMKKAEPFLFDPYSQKFRFVFELIDYFTFFQYLIMKY